jgi:hypothetical protein
VHTASFHLSRVRAAVEWECPLVSCYVWSLDNPFSSYDQRSEFSWSATNAISCCLARTKLLQLPTNNSLHLHGWSRTSYWLPSPIHDLVISQMELCNQQASSRPKFLLYHSCINRPSQCMVTSNPPIKLAAENKTSTLWYNIDGEDIATRHVSTEKIPGYLTSLDVKCLCFHRKFNVSNVSNR